MEPGPRNSLTDVAGILVGNADDPERRTGTTVVLPEEAAVAAVDVRGGAPGTRETDALEPSCLVERVHAVVLSGGSAFGLDAAGGVMTWLAAQGRGFTVGDHVVPIVPAAILFDLHNGGDKDWGEAPPYRELGRRAAAAAAQDFALGNAGAGYGALAGPLKGGLGSASVIGPTGHCVAALAAVNCYGSAVVPDSNSFWAWPFELAGELGGQNPPAAAPRDLGYRFPAALGANTTLVVVATDAALTQAQARRLAIMAHDGLARAVRPVHTPLDGDSVFALSTGRRPLTDPVAELTEIAMLAADCVTRAVARGVYEAESLGEFPCYRERHGAAG